MAVQTKRDRAAVTAGRTFDPEVIRSMSLAFRSVCNALDLKPVDHAVTRLLAEEIIELVESEIRSSAALHLAEFKRPDTSNDGTVGAAKGLRIL